MNVADKINRKAVDSIKKALVGRKIVDVTMMSKAEANLRSWYAPTPVFHLDNGDIFYPSADDGGNDPGVLFTSIPELEVIPVLCG